MTAPDNLLSRYKNDLKRFHNLKAAVKLRYAESIDYRDYEPKIKKLLDTHIQANEVLQLNEPVNIFDENLFNKMKEDRGITDGKSTASKADIIAHATKKAITEKMEEDPAFYEKFSKLIQQAIDDYRAKRISDLEYLNRVSDIKHKVVTRQHEDIPERISGNENALAFYGVLKPILDQNCLEQSVCEDIVSDTAIAIQEILEKHFKIHFWDDEDAKNQAINEIDDFLYDELKGNRNIELSMDQMDEIIEKTMRVARNRGPK
jgi:type I restriction enzyme R subunit